MSLSFIYILIIFIPSSFVLSSSSFDVSTFSVSQETNCFSCASSSYLHRWDELLHHYFPPKNFSDLCWYPSPSSISTVPCSSACFTLVENVHIFNTDRVDRGVMRGCIDRLLLFGLDEDVRERFDSYQRRGRICRETDRKIIKLYALNHEDESVLLCACTGPHCNGQDMRGISNGFIPYPLLPFLLILIYLLM
ncbi:hot-4 [Pristionchus pacificus]|uniref:Uncharacterized protein n=1 Tax=Pristionchus pacificus TaxID=54126 RepID=A0A8R1V561_PRIPA|nr:hot-4 [Pristionchus pacificus]